MAAVEDVRFAKHHWAMDASHAQRDLGWHPGSVEQALERAIHWIKRTHAMR